MDKLSQGAHEEKGDAGSTVSIKANRFRPRCTAYSGQACQINSTLPLCNELLIDSGLKLRPQRGGWLNLASIPRSRMTRAEPDSYRTTPYLRWLLKTHACISSLQLSDDSLRSHSRIVLRELPDDCRLRNLTLDLFPDGHTDAYLQTHLPRLRNLEALSCSTRRDCTDAMAAVSALLRTTKRLKCLVLRGSFGFTQPPKMLIDALAANSTLKWFDLATYWETNMPPGPLGGIRQEQRFSHESDSFRPRRGSRNAPPGGGPHSQSYPLYARSVECLRRPKNREFYHGVTRKMFQPEEILRWLGTEHVYQGIRGHSDVLRRGIGAELNLGRSHAPIRLVAFHQLDYFLLIATEKQISEEADCHNTSVR
ncbi:hypothetical protein MRX96_047316 [Rhipicephalus microplus]